MNELKIVQMLLCPNDTSYQGALLGLGSDGVIYRAENNNKWRVYFPNNFEDQVIKDDPETLR